MTAMLELIIMHFGSIGHNMLERRLFWDHFNGLAQDCIYTIANQYLHGVSNEVTVALCQLIILIIEIFDVSLSKFTGNIEMTWSIDL